MDEALPASELLWLEGASHAGIIEQPEAINAGVRDLITRRVEPRLQGTAAG